MTLPLQAQGIPGTLAEFLDQYGPELVQFAATVAVFLVAFVGIYLVARSVLVRLTRRSLEARGFKASIVSIGTSVVSVLVLVASLALAATVAGFGTVLAAFATLSGALALAVGFAAQDLIANFVAGIFIIRDEPFVTGDWIEWNGNVGVVRDIQLRVTTLDTFDNEQVTVPNAELANAVVTNPDANEELRLAYDFGVGYEDDIERVKEIIVEAGRDTDGVLDEPEPAALVTDLGDSAVVVSGRVWINPRESSAAGVRAAFVQTVKERFDAAGVDMPYPTTEVTGEMSVTETTA
jgi:small-conductance mechanosensitive channel